MKIHKVLPKPSITTNTLPISADGEYRMSAGSSVKLTRKIGDNFVSVEVSFNATIPVTKTMAEKDKKALTEFVQKEVLDDLNAQIAKVSAEIGM